MLHSMQGADAHTLQDTERVVTPHCGICLFAINAGKNLVPTVMADQEKRELKHSFV